MELINIDIEKKVMRCLFFEKDCLVKWVNKGIVPLEVFSDLSIKHICQIIIGHFKKNGGLLNKDLLNAYVNRMALKVKKDAKLFREKIEAVVENSFDTELDKDTVVNFDIYVNELLTLYQGRMIQEHVLELVTKIDSSDIDAAIESVKSFRLVDNDEGVESGDFLADFEKRQEIVLTKKNNPDLFQLLPSGIEQLDAALEGGFSNEFIVIAGSSNTGKSLLIEQMLTNAYLLGKNVILLNIGEMNKVDTQNRIDCNLAGIDFSFFRNPVKNYDEEIHKRWRERIERVKKRAGKFEIIHFRKNTKVVDIMNKVYDVMNRWGEPIHGIGVDSINNIAPDSGKAGSKDWGEYEPICWELFLATKNFRNLNGIYGIPLLSTMQMKKAAKEISSGGKKTRAMREDDVAFTPYGYQYSEIFIAIKSIEENVQSELQIIKGRGISKRTGIICFHNLSMGRFNDPDKAKEAAESVPEEVKNDLEEMEIEVENG